MQALNLESANYVLFDMHYSAEVVLNTYIGGVNVFLGPVLGAALMTFFGNAASDLTQSWLLYQGLLFVLVMMFMPSGPALGMAAMVWLTTKLIRPTFSIAMLMASMPKIMWRSRSRWYWRWCSCLWNSPALPCSGCRWVR